MSTLITIAAALVREINYTDKAGKPAQLLTQTAYLHSLDENGKPGPFPDKFEIVLPRGQTMPYGQGQYTLHPSAIFVDRNGRLSCAPRLVPATTAKA